MMKTKTKVTIALSIAAIAAALLSSLPLITKSNIIGKYTTSEQYSRLEFFDLHFTNKAKVKIYTNGAPEIITVDWYYKQDNTSKSIYLKLEQYGGLTQFSYNSDVKGWKALYGVEKDTIYKKH